MIVGIDQSSKKLAVTILYLPDPDDPFCSPMIEFMGVFSAHKQSGIVDRVHELGEFLDNLIRTRNIELLLCESPLVGRGGVRATILQSMVVGAIYLIAKRHGCVTVDDVHSSTWKKHVVGNGKASKEDVAEWVRTHCPDVHERSDGDQDLLDSYCIATYGHQLLIKGNLLAGGA